MTNTVFFAFKFLRSRKKTPKTHPVSNRANSSYLADVDLLVSVTFLFPIYTFCNIVFQSHIISHDPGMPL